MAATIPGLPPDTWCSCIEASHFEKGKAYVAFDAHRTDDYQPFLFKTTDYGKTWTSIGSNLPFGWIHVVRQDLKNRNLLFTGTEFGIFASLDDGLSWFSLQNDLPTVAVRDIAVHPRENDLIIGTHGRGIWIMDNISPLQEMSEDVLASDAHFFTVRPITAFFFSSRGEPYTRPIYAAQNPDFGLTITCYLKQKPDQKPNLRILDQNGKILFETTLLKKEGIQKFTWNLQFVPKTEEGKEIKPGMAGFMALPKVFPGEYSVILSVDRNEFEQKAIIHPDPRFPFTEEEWKAQQEALTELIILSKKMGLSVTSAKQIRRELDKLYESLEEKQKDKDDVLPAVKSFDDGFRKIEDVIVPKEIGYRGSMEMTLRGGSLSTQILSLGMSIGEFPSAPTETDLAQLKELLESVERLKDQLNEIIRVEMHRLNQILEAQGIKLLKVPKEVKL